MKKLFIFIIAIIIIGLIAAAVYIYNPTLFSKVQLTFSPQFNAVSISEDSLIHFYKEGIIVIDEAPLYYDWNGNEVEPTFLYEDPEDAPQKILLHTTDYILTDKGVIYNTSTVPFVKVYESTDIKTLDIKDFGDFLLILTEDSQGVGRPYLLIKGSDFLLALDGLGSTNYLTSDCHLSSEGLSVLTLDVDSPVPVTRIFHYNHKNQPYGVLSLDDSFYYSISRLQKHIVLVGSSNISCYNIDSSGDPVWTIDKSDMDFESIKTDDSLVMYLKGSLVENQKEGNTIFIDKEGNYIVKMLPKFLSSLKPFRKGFAGLEYDNTILVLDKHGRTVSKTRLDKSVRSILTTDYIPDTIFITTKDNQLLSLTTSKGKE